MTCIVTSAHVGGWLIQLVLKGFLFGVYYISFFATDKVGEVYLYLNCLNISIKVHEKTFFLSVQGLQGKVDDFFDLPGAVAHSAMQIFADFPPYFLVAEKKLFLGVSFINIFCGHIQDHFA